jgi:hypothetical protein
MSRSKMSRVVSSFVVLSASNPRTLIISFSSLSSKGDLFVQGDPVAEQVIAYPKTAHKAPKVDRPQDRPTSPPRLTARVNPTIYVFA